MACPYVDRELNDRSLRCTRLAASGAKWDFCIHQYFCRQKGKYALDDKAASCTVAAQKGESKA